MELFTGTHFSEEELEGGSFEGCGHDFCRPNRALENEVLTTIATMTLSDTGKDAVTNIDGRMPGNPIHKHCMACF